MIELLAPAGSYESLVAAVNAGADAIYIGGTRFGARAYADNPEEDRLIDGVSYCHLHGRKLYMTVNTLLKEEELSNELYDFLLPYYKAGVDGLIIQDFGVAMFVKEHFPFFEIHSSTQMTITSAYGAGLMKENGICRVVPARELSLQEIKEIIDQTGIEVETFIHGAMCYCYSGQCLFSSFLGGRSGNRGRCAQPCRLPYERIDHISRKSGKNNKNTDIKEPYLLSMKDMCTLDHIPDLVDTGIASLKIEGRMKRPEYTAGVVKIYRKYIDLYLEKGRSGFQVLDEDRKILMDLYNRGGFSMGYYRQHNGKEMMALVRPNHQGTRAARVISSAKGDTSAIALENLNRKDLIEIRPEFELALKNDIPKGKQFHLQTGKVNLSNGTVLYRTKNQKLLTELNQSYVQRKIKEKIKGELIITEENPAILSLSCGTVTVSVSAEIAEPAKENPTSSDSVLKQLNKTGATPFAFEECKLQLSADLFIPVQKLNDLRRKGLEALEEAILDQYRQNRQPVSAPVSEPASVSASMSQNTATSQKRELHIFLTLQEQLKVLLESELAVDVVYLDSMLFMDVHKDKTFWEYKKEQIRILKEKGCKVIFSFPPVFRKLDRSFLQDGLMEHIFPLADGFLLHTIDQLSFIKSCKSAYSDHVILIADDTLYGYNTRAEQFLLEMGIHRMVLPAELTAREMMQLKRQNAILNIYGHQALMQSAQCVVKNTTGCARIPGIHKIKDRKEVTFPLINRCETCCNTIYNSVPLNLFGYEKEIERIGVSAVKLNFTVENKEEMLHVLGLYQGLCADQTDHTQNGTRGHFKKGVE